ncbi:unnamed protein product [Clavelina lepadiformis]|uniref:Uncharacterized protein n=1 Tax=Clavelina lepadiformis TaxID=159417 RepID=A0ABP0FCF0_CLALP
MDLYVVYGKNLELPTRSTEQELVSVPSCSRALQWYNATGYRIRNLEQETCITVRRSRLDGGRKTEINSTQRIEALFRRTAARVT